MMSNKNLILDYVRRLAAQGCDQVPDRELIRRFVDAGDQDAFAALVRRHGSMVFGVCRHCFLISRMLRMSFRQLSSYSAVRPAPLTGQNRLGTGFTGLLIVWLLKPEEMLAVESWELLTLLKNCQPIPLAN